MTLTAATLFSGIGAPEVAMPSWRWAWHAEIEKFPCAVMDARHPLSVNLGDVTADGFAETAAAVARPDILVFGSPCQSFSVAGKRLGLDDPRGNLALVALGIVARLKPSWLLFENVPGLLSSAEGRDFGLFLRTVDELGYCCAWSVLDAQFFGVAQRRRRVFVVGHLGDWRRAAAVLLEPESLRGHSPPRREAGERPAPTIASRPTGGGGLGTDFDCDGGLIGSDDISRCLMAKSYRHDPELESYAIAHTLCGEGFDATEDGTGRGTPIIPILEAGARTGKSTTDPRVGGGIGEPGDPMFTLQSTKQHAIAFDCKASGQNGFGVGEIASTLRAMNSAKRHHNAGGQLAVAVALRGREGGGTAELSEVPSALRASTGGGDKVHVLTSTVRRLTPRECERLQGFPDDYTLIQYRKKPAADGPRYKALGNSMAVPVVRWVLKRIEAVT